MKYICNKAVVRQESHIQRCSSAVKCGRSRGTVVGIDILQRRLSEVSRLDNRLVGRESPSRDFGKTAMNEAACPPVYFVSIVRVNSLARELRMRCEGKHRRGQQAFDWDGHRRY
jgi:hypothetical protein